jgi:glycolate oxidase
LDKQQLINQFLSFLPAETVLFQHEELVPYECDGLSVYRKTPVVVLLPKTIEQVQQVLTHCHRHRIPLVARGAGTGLSGGALPNEEGVLLSLARFNQILEVDLNNQTARVQPGVTNLAISNQVKKHGLYYAPDPSSQIACTIGGNVAENSGGVHCLKYGLTVHNVTSIEIITIDGERITLGCAALDSAGYDLLALFNGSEGMLGVIVEVTVKLLPIPEQARTLLAAFDSVEKAGQAVGEIIAAGVIPAGLEMMDKLSIRAVRPRLELQKMLPRGSCSGKDANLLFPRWDAYLQTITAWMARYREVSCRLCLKACWKCLKIMVCVLPMFFMLVTVIFIRLFFMTQVSRASWKKLKNLVVKFWSYV